MFTDIWTARRSALSLSETLMVVTLVIAIGQQFAVITAEDADGDVAILQSWRSSVTGRYFAASTVTRR